jgi:hypothetical protein
VVRVSRQGGAKRRAVAAAVAVAGTLALLAPRLRRRRGRAAQGVGPPARREWKCRCGQEYLVSGTDRHRIYWVAGAAAENPVLGQDCVRCGARLPAEREAAAA